MATASRYLQKGYLRGEEAASWTGVNGYSAAAPPPKPPEFKLVLLFITAALGAVSTIAADRYIRGEQRAEQFAAVQQILSRLEKKVDQNAARNERDFEQIRQRLTSLGREQQRESAENRTAIAVLEERVDGISEREDALP